LKKKSILFLFSESFPLPGRIGNFFIAPLSQLPYSITSRFCSSFLIKIFLVKQNEKIFDQKSFFFALGIWPTEKVHRIIAKSLSQVKTFEGPLHLGDTLFRGPAA
jgi:hypothetical protein